MWYDCDCMSKLVFILLERPTLLTEPQVDKLADVFINIGTLFFGSGVILYLIPGLDKPRLLVLILGLGFSVGSWVLAILSVRRIRL